MTPIDLFYSTSPSIAIYDTIKNGIKKTFLRNHHALKRERATMNENSQGAFGIPDCLPPNSGGLLQA
jgi:hypothetical protein